MGLRQRFATAAGTIATILAAASASAAQSPAVNAAFNVPPTPAGDFSGPPPRGVRPWRKTRNRPRLTPLPINVTRWVQRDIEAATLRAQSGDMSTIGQLHRAMWRDGTIKGVSGTRTGGLIRLPKKFRGTPHAVKTLGGQGNEATLFDTIFPPAELAMFMWDGINCGFALAQFVQGEEDRYPVFVRLDPEFLVYRWAEDRWYYRTLEGLLPITPGDGRWILHTPEGRYEPWNRGAWRALARSFISKEHAILYRENYGSKLANPARVAVMPQGANEAQKQSWFSKVMGWGVNTVFGAPPGYDVKIVESNGQGYEVFKDIIDHADRDSIIGIAGQVVTTDGGTGFSNQDIHKSIRADIIQGDGNAICSTLNSQALPAVVYDVCGPAETCCVEWDTTPPADVKAAADSLSACADAIDRLDVVLKPRGLTLDVGGLCARFSVPLLSPETGLAESDPKVRVADELPPAPSPGELLLGPVEVPDLDFARLDDT